MNNTYVYCPILKTRQSEIDAYDMLDQTVKDSILPIIEMTGALGYTYPKNYKIESLRHTHRRGDIYTKINKILNLVGDRRFILDITDDLGLMYDGLKEEGGLLDHSNGYEKWISFLKKDEKFCKLVIPTIQFDTNYKDDLVEQIKKLDAIFDYIAIKLPAFLSDTNSYSSNVIFNDSIVRIISWVASFIQSRKLLLIIDFGYINNYEDYKKLIEDGLRQFKNWDNEIIKALIPVSSSFPSFVKKVSKPIGSYENTISSILKNTLKVEKNFLVVHGDYASLFPTKYDFGGGGWIARIDYIVRDSVGKPVAYDYARGKQKNTSAEFPTLARVVVESDNYKPISDVGSEGDRRILNKAKNGKEGNAPSYWIAVRSNIYITSQYLYLKETNFGSLSL